MLVGILSDTHDRPAPTKAAIAALRQAGAEYLLHCGDIGGEQIIDLLASAGVPALFVCGNCDFDPQGLCRYAQAVGVRCEIESAELELAGKRIAVSHGDRPTVMRQLLCEAKPDYLFHGHTHVQRDERVGPTRIINPGALHRTSGPTVALLDTENDAVRFIPITSPR